MLRLLLLLPVFRFITGAFDGAIRPIEWPRKSIHQPRVLVDEPFFGSAVQSRLEVLSSFRSDSDMQVCVGLVVGG